MNRTLAIALLATTALATATACTSGSGSGTPAAGPTATATATTAARKAVDPGSIAGLQIANDSSEESTCRWATSYPVVPGADALTAAMRQDVKARLASFLDAAGSGTSSAGTRSCPGGDSAPELNVSYQFLVASGNVVAVRLTTLDRGSAGNGISTRTYWYDGDNPHGGAKATALIADGSLDRLVSDIKAKLKGREGIDSTLFGSSFEAGQQREAALGSMAFTADGSLTVHFDQGLIAVPAAGQFDIVLPKSRITPLLSDFGRRAQRQAVAPASELDLGVTPTPVSTPTAAPEPQQADCSKVKCVALTFDDGPGPYTHGLLNTLAKYNAHATFFVVGQNVAAYPSLVRAEATAGHEIGNHSWNHPDLTRLTAPLIRSQLSRTNAAIKSATGSAPTLMRPPYGAINATVRQEAGVPMVLWSVDTEDWKYRDSNRVANSVINTVKPGDIVLIHDIHPTSVAAVPRVLSTLGARGYHFVTVSQLFGGKHLKTGIAYGDNPAAFGR